MQKYTNGLEVCYFDSDVNISDWIDLSKYREMTIEEIDRHENPMKYWTNKQVIDHKRSLLPHLTKLQFSLSLDDLGLYDSVMLSINSDRRLKVKYESISHIKRSSDVVKSIGLTEHIIDEIWLHALKEY